MPNKRSFILIGINICVSGSLLAYLFLYQISNLDEIWSMVVLANLTLIAAYHVLGYLLICGSLSYMKNFVITMA